MQTPFVSLTTQVFNNLKNLFSLSALAAGAAILLLPGCANSPGGFTSTTVTSGTPCFVNSPPVVYQVNSGYPTQVVYANGYVGPLPTPLVNSVNVVYANGYVGPLPTPIVNSVNSVNNVTKQITRNNVLNASAVSIKNNQVLQNNAVTSVENQVRQARPGIFRNFPNNLRMASQQLPSFAGNHRRHVVNNINQVTKAPSVATPSSSASIGGSMPSLPHISINKERSVEGMLRRDINRI